MLEKIDDKVKPISECHYPACEYCFAFNGGVCTVPIVIDKQSYIELRAEIDQMKNDISELGNTLYDEILGQKAGIPKEIYERVAYGLPNDYGDDPLKGATMPELYVDKHGLLTVKTGDKEAKYGRIEGE